MKVEIVGGPKDGSVMKVPDHWRDITFAISSDLQDFLSDPDKAQVTARTVLVPIEHDKRRFFVRWPKEGK